MPWLLKNHPNYLHGRFLDFKIETLKNKTIILMPLILDRKKVLDVYAEAGQKEMGDPDF